MENRKTVIEFYLKKSIVIIYGVMMAGIILLCLFSAGINYAEKTKFTQYLPAWILMPAGIVFLCGLYLLSVSAARHVRKARKGRLAVISVALFLLQVYFVWNYYFTTGWDAGTLKDFSNAVAHGEDVSGFIRYFSRYQNNLMLAFIFASIRKMIHFIGFHRYEYMALLCIQCLINTLTGFFLAKVLGELFHDNVISVLGYLLYILLVGTSPWTSIPYSDSMGLLFPILMIDIYINRRKSGNMIFTWFKLGSIAFLGYQIKPQIFIVFIAICIMECITWIGQRTGAVFLRKMAGALIGIVCVLLISKLAVASLGIPIDKEKTFHMQHFFMMGMNPDRMGVYDSEDVAYSASFSTSEERDSEDMKKAWERIRDMGVVGVLKQLGRKTLMNYNDGTFFWTGEGGFYVEFTEPRKTPLCGLLRGLYYKDLGEGIYFNVWSNFMQMLWLTALLLSVCSVFGDMCGEKTVIMLAIIGLTIFEMIFEARSRYLYTFVPLYIIIAMYGANAAAQKLNLRKIIAAYK